LRWREAIARSSMGCEKGKVPNEPGTPWHSALKDAGRKLTERLNARGF